MRQLILYAVAVSAGMLLATTGWSQQIGNDSILSQIQYPTNYNTSYSRQDAVVTVPSQSAEPAVAVATTGDCGGCGASGYSYGNYFNRSGRALARTSNDANWVGGVYGLIFKRDNEDDVPLSYDPADPTNIFATSTDAEMCSMGGFEAVIARRGCGGQGFEARYWGLYPNTRDFTLANSPNTALGNLDQVNFGAFNVYGVYNAADSHRLYRDNTFHNLELNLMCNMSSGNCCGTNWEWLAGFRWLRFDESFRYATFTTAGGYPASLFYDTRVANNLYGFQVGGRSERYLNCNWGVQFSTKVGIFGNHLDHQQSIHDGAGTFATIGSGPYAGQDYAFDSNKNDFAMLAELNLGLVYQFAENLRASGGYRAIGVSGVGLAPDQIPINFTDVRDINRIDSNGSLILHGLYLGLERSF